jgi:hypothetical protein
MQLARFIHDARSLPIERRYIAAADRRGVDLALHVKSMQRYDRPTQRNERGAIEPVFDLCPSPDYRPALDRRKTHALPGGRNRRR